MGDLLVVGSVALDSVETPFGKVREALGGSATYFSYSASFFTQVRLVAAVGEDFPEAHLRLLADRGVDITGLQTSKGRTFRWAGQYSYDLNEAKTLDTMNFWIQGKQEALRRVLAEVDVVTINDGEARQLASEPNLIRAARAIAGLGPRTVVVKRGEYGALMLTDGAFFFVPAYPLESVYDPTGAGDTFAGGFMGYLAAQERVDAAAMRRALAYGSVMASFTVEDFSLKRLTRLKPADIADRYAAFYDLIRLEP